MASVCDNKVENPSNIDEETAISVEILRYEIHLCFEQNSNFETKTKFSVTLLIE